MDQDKFDRVLNAVACGSSAKTAVKNEGYDWGSFYRFLRLNDEAYASFTRAKEARAELLADDLLSIADGTAGGAGKDFNERRLMVDTRKWLASKMLPKQYGAKTAVDVNGAADTGIHITITSDDTKI